MCQDQWNVDGYMVIHYPGLSTSVHVWNWKVWSWGVSVWRSGVPLPLLALMCLFPRVAKMAPSCSRLTFHLLGNPMGKRMSPSQPFQQRSKGSLFLIGQEDIVSLSPNQSQWPRDCSVLTGSEALAPLDWEWSQGGSLKGKRECCWLRKWERMLGRHDCRHPLLLWNRGDSPLKVIVTTFEGHSGVRDQQWTVVAAQLKHSAGDYCFP